MTDIFIVPYYLFIHAHNIPLLRLDTPEKTSQRVPLHSRKQRVHAPSSLLTSQRSHRIALGQATDDTEFDASPSKYLDLQNEAPQEAG